MVFLVAIVVVVSAVHADHPLAPTRYWRSQSVHYHPLALAKLVFAVSVAVGMPVSAQLLTLLLLRLPLAAAAPEIVNSAFWCLSFAVSALLLASLTNHLKSTVFVIAGLLLARGFAASNLLPADAASLLKSSREIPALNWLLIPAMLLAFAWTYRNDSVGAGLKRTVVACVLVLATLLWTPTNLLTTSRQPIVVSIVDSTTRAVPLELRSANLTSGNLSLVLATPVSSPGKRILLVLAVVVVHFSDGTSETLRTSESVAPRAFRDEAVALSPQAAPLARMRLLTWQSYMAWTGNAPLAPTPVRIEVDALLEEQTYHIRLHEPLRVGAAVSFGTSHFRVKGMVPSGALRSASVEHLQFSARPLIAEVHTSARASSNRTQNQIDRSLALRDTAVLWDGEIALGTGFHEEPSAVDHAELPTKEGVGQLILPTRSLRRHTHLLSIDEGRDIAALRIVIGEWVFHSVALARTELTLRNN